MVTRTQRLQEAFKLFTGKDENRPGMLYPFKQGNFFMATDAHSLMWVEAKFDLGFVENAKAPNAIAIIPKEKHKPVTINIEALEKEMNENTPLIDEMKECYSCSGIGWEECNLGHKHDCERCDGKGEYEAGNGKKVPDDDFQLILNGQYFRYCELYRLIKACKCLEIKDINKVGGYERKPAIFEADEANFLVMPCFHDPEQDDRFYELKLKAKK